VDSTTAHLYSGDHALAAFRTQLSLTSRLFVLTGFFVAVAVAALVRIESDVTLLLALLIAAASPRRAIILRVTSRRVLAGAFASAVLHTLISFSIVCHKFPPLGLVD
jgi:hypothetical protein